VEVWFDQSELRGGDAWDANIRKQIKECALFVPVISANTQARAEGYFRREWRLAVDRMHDLADDHPFLLPVVIDDTPDAAARVPERFRERQWTRLPGGETSSAFAQRAKKLLAGSYVAAVATSATASAADPGPASARPATAKPAQTSGKKQKRWLAPVIAGAAVVLLVLTLSRPWEKTPTPTGGSASGPAANPAAPLSGAGQLVAQARGLMYKADSLRTDFDTAAGLLERASKLDPTEVSIWSTWAVLDARYIDEVIDRSPERLDSARRHAAQAIGLNPGHPDARFAQAYVMSRLTRSPASAAEAEKILRPLLTDTPNDGRVPLELARVANIQGRVDEALDLFDRAARFSGLTARAESNKSLMLAYRRRMIEAERAVDQSLAAERTTFGLLVKAWMALEWHGDTNAAEKLIAEIPPQMLVEDTPAMWVFFVHYWRRDFDRALAAARAVPHDYLLAEPYNGPTGYFKGLALAGAGRMAAAKIEWRTALETVERRLAAEPNNLNLLQYKALLLALLGDRAGGEQVWKTAVELYGDTNTSLEELALRVQFLPADQAFNWINGLLKDPPLWLTAASLRLDPTFDPLRQDPRFAMLTAEVEADPRFTPDPTKPGSGAPAKVDDKSVAVLAFTNLSEDKGNEYFSDGISEELLNVLAKIPDLKVAARTSAFYFKGKEVPVPEIAKQLGVAYVVEGSVRKSGDRVRITAQLIKAADGFHVWSDTFTRDLKDIFGVQDEIAGLIAKNLELKMGIAQSEARPAIRPEAYQEFLLGRAAAAKDSMADLHEAVTHFERAVALEPKYTAAWIQLARAHTQLGRWGGAPTLQAWQAARDAIDHARALEPDSPDVLLALGWILRTSDWDWRGAERAFRRSIELRPNQPDALAGLAVLLFNIGKTDEAFRLGGQAVKLDPLNASTQIDLSIMYYLNYDWAESERSTRRALQLAPGGTSYHSVLSWSLISQQRYDEAEAEAAQDTDEVEKPTALGFLAIARGQGAAAREQLAHLEELAHTRGDSADLQQSIAWLSANLGEKDRAFAALEKARASRDPSMSWLRNSWYLKPLYSDPRWGVLLHQVGLADDQLK
jgi:TolB-like protein/Flp pilus assembly protein TadD